MTVKTSKRELIHFIGIGGIGVSAIARLCMGKGNIVQGSDQILGVSTNELKEIGIKIFHGHDEINISKDIDLVVYSSAINQNNVELVQAKKLGIRVLSRAEMLKIIMSEKECICVSGTHGKTTCTSMISWLLSYDKFNIPTSLIGGIDYGFMSNLQTGSGDLMIVEADESDKTFLSLPSKISIITNIDDDHLEKFGSMQNLTEDFLKFANNVDEDGYLIVCKNDPVITSLLSKFVCPNTISYGEDFESNFCINNIIPKENSIGYFFNLKGTFQGREYDLDFEIDRPGRYNIYNATAAIIVGLIRGFSVDLIKERVKSYKGVYRRFSFITENNGVSYFDDYAHHPTELTHLLSSAREVCSENLICIFQPHRYSRVTHLYERFCEVFKGVKLLLLLPIYSAGEKTPDNFNYDNFVRDIKGKSNVDVLFVYPDEIKDKISKNANNGDMVIFTGAGDINLISKRLCQEL